MKAELNTYLQQLGAFDEDEIEIICQGFYKRSLRTGEKLTGAGSIAGELYFINDGILKITSPQDEQRDLVYYFMEKNRLMAFLYSIYGDIPVTYGLQAACDCELMVLDKAGLYRIFEMIPKFRTLLDGIAHLSMVEMIAAKNAYSALNAAGSYQLFLERQPQLLLQVALNDIASYLGITPQSLSRIRKLTK
jgi:CRP-like cAMP-binding protein